MSGADPTTDIVHAFAQATGAGREEVTTALREGRVEFATRGPSGHVWVVPEPSAGTDPNELALTFWRVSGFALVACLRGEREWVDIFPGTVPA